MHTESNTFLFIMPSKTSTSKVSKPKVSKTSKPSESTSKPTESTSKPTVSTSKPTVPANTTETQSSIVLTQIQKLQEELSNLTTHISTLKKSLTSIHKEYSKERKQWQKLQSKKKSGGSGVKHQSGIAKPGFISPALCNFIGVIEGTEMARTEVIKFVNKYIKEKELQDNNNKKVIVPDAKLQTLLQSKNSDEITYFNLQTYMKPHYANPQKEATAT